MCRAPCSFKALRCPTQPSSRPMEICSAYGGPMTSRMRRHHGAARGLRHRAACLCPASWRRSLATNIVRTRRLRPSCLGPAPVSRAQDGPRRPSGALTMCRQSQRPKLRAGRPRSSQQLPRSFRTRAARANTQRAVFRAPSPTAFRVSAIGPKRTLAANAGRCYF